MVIFLGGTRGNSGLCALSEILEKGPVLVEVEDASANFVRHPPGSGDRDTETASLIDNFTMGAGMRYDGDTTGKHRLL